MDYHLERLKYLDAKIEWEQFRIAAAQSVAGKILPYIGAVSSALRRKILVDRIVLERKSVMDTPAFAQRVVHAAGFERPWDVVSWVESGRSVYGAWQKAKAAGDFSLLVPAAEKRYALARGIGLRRIEAFNHIASALGHVPMHKISHSFIDRETPGLDSFKVDCMSEDVAFWGAKFGALTKAFQAETISIPRATLEGITPHDKMALARRLLDTDPDGLSHVVLAAIPNPLCQGYGQKIGMGLNPEHSFFVFLKGYRHERAHAAYRTHLRGSPPSAALDEVLPLMDEHFILPDMGECQAILDHLADVMGARFPKSLTAEHIKQGFSSIQPEDMGADPDYMTYAIHRAIYNRTEARMLDEAIPMEQFPDILAEHVWMFTGETLTHAQAEKMALDRFQPFFSLGRGKAYEASIFAAAALAQKLKNMDSQERRAWLHENLYSLEQTPQFMVAVEMLTGAPLSARGLELGFPSF